MEEETFHEQLKRLTDEYAHLVYLLTKSFPKAEMYGSTSQLRRSALSVPLNYIEGYARARSKVHKNFLEISFGSLKECQYLLAFCREEGYLTEADCLKATALGDRIGAMIWGMLRRM